MSQIIAFFEDERGINPRKQNGFTRRGKHLHLLHVQVHEQHFWLEGINKALPIALFVLFILTFDVLHKFYDSKYITQKAECHRTLHKGFFDSLNRISIVHVLIVKTYDLLPKVHLLIKVTSH